MALEPEKARRAHLALQRFGLGAKGDILREIASDPRGALLAEIADSAAAQVAGGSLKSTPEALRALFAEQRAERQEASERRDARRETNVARGRSRAGGAPADPLSDSPMMEPPASPQAASAPQPVPVQQAIFREEAMARFRHGHEARIGFAERLAQFWSNHFCVSAGKGPLVRATAGAFEREAIRPHALGRFRDMLLAAEKHPAMLVYLDNRQSVGPGSRAGQNRRLGLNENLAREILELHTLGADAGYSQADVSALARLITGWTVVGPQEQRGPAGTFAFAANRHEPGPQRVLGRTYEGEGLARGERALGDLSRHPATARHIARKLARAFVADEPPPGLVKRLARVFEESEGDLRAVAEALVKADEAWTLPMTKLRSPCEFLLQATRMLGLPQQPGPMLRSLVLMGAPLWTPPGPNGFPDTAAHWASPEAMRIRLDLTAAMARRQQQPPQPLELAGRLLDGALSDETLTAIRRAETRQQGLALLLMSPELQRR
jgi:uncharacterized protein (DUF1800 family)